MDILMRHTFFLLGLVIISLLPSAHAAAAVIEGSTTSREYKIKAAFLYNFTKFTSWPTDKFGNKQSPLNICLIGHDPFGLTMDTTTNGKLVKGRSITVLRINHIADTDTCHLLFIGTSKNGRLTEILTYVSELPILTVTDGEDDNEGSGIINLVTIGNKIRFEINPTTANRAGIHLSAQLLKLALIIGL